MADRSINVAQARNDVQVANALLVCAYEDDEKCKQNQLEDSISLQEFSTKKDELTEDREIIFYCACPNDELSSELAQQYQDRGFRQAKFLEGGVEAWKNQGFPVA